MVQIRENMQKQSVTRYAGAQLLCTDLAHSTVWMFVTIINVPGRKAGAP